MRKIIIKYTLLVVLFFAVTTNSSAQFEQKLTLQGSGGLVLGLAPESFVDIFNVGFSVDAGVQYNFSRTFSVVAMAKYATYFFTPEDEFSLETAKFNQLGISVCPKIRFFPRSRVNPYLFGGASINHIVISFSMEGEETRSKDEPISLGAIAGAGIDFRINDNIALFWQLGLNRVDFDVVYIDAFFQQVGLNINLFKSKSL
ncbi:MAG: outer membrane beta-barrel protein [Tenuifilaceae bacterium]|jgi:opacity protein-like surface antigen|nr:outer membrane beta-barrel protein [Tenuifilaceae bacterium]